MNGYTINKIKDSFWKVLVVIFGVAFIGFIVYYRLDQNTSKFKVYQNENTLIFIDKYVSKSDSSRFIAEWKAIINNFLTQANFSETLKQKKISYYPEVIFFVDNFYSVISLEDPYIEKYLKGRPGGDFQLLQKARLSVFFDSLISHSYTSNDGRYIFFSNAENLEADLLYAYTHGIISYNMPESARKQLRVDSNWDFYAYTTWLLLEEMAAISVQEMARAFKEGKTLDQAVAFIQNLPADYYTRADSPALKNEEEFIALSFREPDKTVSVYQACLEMAKHLITQKGKEGFLTYLGNLFTGSYTTISELVQNDLQRYIDPIANYYNTVKRARSVEGQTSTARPLPPSQ